MASYITYPMVLNNVYVGIVDVRTDQLNYFNIPTPSPEELAKAKYTVDGSDYQRNLFSQRLDSDAPTRLVTVDRKSMTRDRGKFVRGRGGKPIKIPTELRSVPPTSQSTNPADVTIKRGTIRFTTMRFPGHADLSEISAWLHLKLVSHKPLYMISPSGRTYPVAPFPVGNRATGPDTTP